MKLCQIYKNDLNPLINEKYENRQLQHIQDEAISTNVKIVWSTKWKKGNENKTNEWKIKNKININIKRV